MRSWDNKKPEALVVRLARKSDARFPSRLRQLKLTVRVDLIHLEKELLSLTAQDG
jgi:hypothetical protein